VFKSENKRLIIMKRLFENDKITLYPLVDILSYFENEHVRFTDKDAIKETIFTVAHVLEFENIIVKRIKNEAESGIFINNNCFITLFYFWKKINEESVKEYVNKLITDDTIVLDEIIERLRQNTI
jgi:di/tricarboxylate transporter